MVDRRRETPSCFDVELCDAVDDTGTLDIAALGCSPEEPGSSSRIGASDGALAILLRARLQHEKAVHVISLNTIKVNVDLATPTNMTF